MTLLLLLACNDGGLTKHNSLPEAQLTAPEAGTSLREGAAVTLRGAASDPNHPSGLLRARWFVNDAEACASAAPDADGTTTCVITVPATDTLAARLEVVDPDGAAATVSRTWEVTPDAAPSVSITAPADGTRTYAEQLLTLRALVGDAEDAPETLGLAWRSSLDGDLGLASTVTSTGQVEAFATLSQGTHALQLFVADSAGNEVVDSVVIQVGPPNSAPGCAILAPTPGTGIAVGDPLALRGTATDPDQDSDLLVATWSSDLDGLLGIVAPDSAGIVALSAGGLSVGTHLVTMDVRDEVGERCTALVDVTVGTPPTLEVLAPIEGEVVNEGETLTFQARALDAEDASDALRIVWDSDRDGPFALGAPDAAGSHVVEAADLSVGEHALTVTLTDTTGLASVVRRTLTVNGLPTAPAVSLAPTTPRTDDDLVATVTVPSIDPEGDALTYAWAWARDRVPSGASTGATLPASATARGERWTVEVWASDGLGESPVGSAGVTIANTAPELASVTVSPSAPTRGSTLTCAAAGASDRDGDAVSVTYAWTVDGAAAGGGDTLTGPFTTGSVVTCTATPDDGTDAGSAARASVTITNTPPEITGVSLSPARAYTNDTLVATVASADADGDTVALAYAWTVNGVAVAETGPSLAGATYFDRGDTVAVTVTPSDSDGAGTPFTSGAVTVLNTAPTTPAVTITPGAPTAPTGLACGGVATDADGDVLGYALDWTVDGSAFTAATTSLWAGDTVPAASVAWEDVWTCGVTATDGTDSSPRATATVTLPCAPGASAACAARTCKEILDLGASGGSGVYWVDPSGSSPFQAYCDMTTDGGGWTRVGFERAGDTQTFKYLGLESGSAAGVAAGSSSGLIGTRFAGIYTEFSVTWSGYHIRLAPTAEVFTNTVATSVAVTSFSTNEPTLGGWVSAAGGAHFCRASSYPSVRPGDTSWAVKALSDTNTGCGCNSGGWTGRGAYYGGHPSPTVCDTYPGAWSATRDTGVPKGGYSVAWDTTLWVR